MNTREVEAAAKAFAPVVRGYVDKVAKTIRAEISEAISDAIKMINDKMAESIAAIPVVDTQGIAEKAALLVKVEPGKDGESVSIEEIQQLIDDATVKAISELPVPKDGHSVTIDDVKPMIDEAVSTAVSAIPAPKDGKSVSPDDVRSVVDEAVEKAISEIEIVAPEDGKPGRDALEIDLLPRIDAEKSYPRGTWATHHGGIWRAHSTTDGMRGWECVVDGQHEIRIDQIDARTFESVAISSSGKEVRRKMALPTMVYCGIFKEGNDYQKGDMVTFGGSLWHCNTDTKTKPGDAAKDWQLCAKRGRDGKSS